MLLFKPSVFCFFSKKNFYFKILFNIDFHLYVNFIIVISKIYIKHTTFYTTVRIFGASLVSLSESAGQLNITKAMHARTSN